MVLIADPTAIKERLIMRNINWIKYITVELPKATKYSTPLFACLFYSFCYIPIVQFLLIIKNNRRQKLHSGAALNKLLTLVDCYDKTVSQLVVFKTCNTETVFSLTGK